MDKKIIDNYYNQIRNEQEGYKKDRLFFKLSDAQEILEIMSFECDGEKYVGLNHKMVDEAIKIHYIKENRTKENFEKGEGR